MKKFISYTLIFGLPILIAGIKLEFLLRKIPNDYTFKNNYLSKESNNIEVIILGSSHTFFGIDPEFMKMNCFNAAHTNQTLDYDLEILKKYKDNWNNLKYIVIPIDYFSMFFSIKMSEEAWFKKNYILYYQINSKGSFKNRFELFSNKMNYNYKRVYNYIIKGKTDLTCHKLGWSSSFSNGNKRFLFQSGIAAAKRHTVKNEKFFSRNRIVLREIIDFAHKRKVKIIFITCPTYYSYYINLDTNILNRTYKVINNLVKINPDIKYYNFLKDWNFNSNDFYDADHLNSLGAKKLTFKIDSIISQSK